MCSNRKFLRIGMMAFVVVGLGAFASGAEICQRWVAGPLTEGFPTVLSTTNLGSARIVMGGLFTQSIPNQSPAHNLVVWNGLTLSRLANLNGTEGTNGMVRALESITTGGPFGGTTLYVGGDFTVAGLLNANRVARWSEPGGGEVPSWSAMGAGFNGSVHALEIHNNELYAGGSFTSSGVDPITGIARWTGTAWQAVNGGTNGTVYALKSYNGNLYVGGSFATAGGIATGGLAKWNSVGWSQTGPTFSGTVRAFEIWNGLLVIGGSFATQPGTPNVMTFNGSGFGNVDGFGTNGGVMALKTDGDWLYMGGAFTSVGVNGGGLPASRLIRYASSTGWNTLSGGVTGGDVHALGVLQSELHAGGSFAFVGSPSGLSMAWGRYLTTGAAWIAQQPVGQTINCNSNANFNIQVAGGYGGASATWKRFGEALQDGVTPHGSLISGANTTTMSITNAKAPDIGSYQCVVQSGSCGSAASTAVTLRVNNCCQGDIEGGDSLVNIDDLLALIEAWGWTGPTGGHPADIDSNGQVNVDDLLLIIKRWGACA